MAKSNETFIKKEKEKKRLKKQQEKKEKSESRKANSSKGKTLEDMMAYIDENGNITSTPPTAGAKKPAILAESILTATPKQVDTPDDEPKTGIVTFFNTSKGFGFIREVGTQNSIFFHTNNLTFPAKENDKVSFLTEKGPKGPVAVKIEKAK